MRLLKDVGHETLSLVEKHESDNLRYAILSHTWGAEEVTFKDLVEGTGTGKNKAGYEKIEFCRKQAASDGLICFWVDTCCIDKSSSAELSEAINSMFRWYRNADKCYVYLSDVSTAGGGRKWETAFRGSRWFTLGWTLQELIAPASVEFFSREGDRLGSKFLLADDIHDITGIAIEALRGASPKGFTVEERLRWAKHRETKRPEDKAYSLLGIFDIDMSPRYGEGEDKALERLRRKIEKFPNPPLQRSEILPALGADLLASTSRIESTLATIGHSAGFLVDQRTQPVKPLLESRQKLHPSLLIQPDTPGRTQAHASGSSNISGPRRAVSIQDQSPGRNIPHHKSGEKRLHDAQRALLVSAKQEMLVGNSHSVTVANLDPFERLSSVEPESLTCLTDFSTLFAYHCRETETGDYTRVNQFAMLYAKSPRHWVRLIVSITISVESEYWCVWKIQSVRRSVKCAARVPTQVLLNLKKFLDQCVNIEEQDYHLSMFLGRGCTGRAIEPSSWPAPYLSPTPPEDIAYRLDITERVFHWGCRRFNERQLQSQRPLNQNVPSCDFIAWLEGRWVLLLRFGSNRSRDESLYYLLRVLHCARDSPGINPLVGVALDDATGIIQGVVCDLPAHGMLAVVMAKATESRACISWERRVKWCRQIVAGTFAVHSNNLVVGAFSQSPNCGVAINSNDDAVLYKMFQDDIISGIVKPGRLPPECRKEAAKNPKILVTPALDIWQLGLVLWGVVVNKPTRLVPDFCEIAGCPPKISPACDEPHANPTQLSMPENAVPMYLREIIMACRRDCSHRPAAWELLQMFPADAGICENTEKRGTNFSLKEYLDQHNIYAFCDNCSGLISHSTVAYHCDICGAGDYDMCRHCFDGGRHCLDSGHYLQEVNSGVIERLYSSITSSGLREELQL